MHTHASNTADNHMTFTSYLKINACQGDVMQFAVDSSSYFSFEARTDTHPDPNIHKATDTADHTIDASTTANVYKNDQKKKWHTKSSAAILEFFLLSAIW